MACVGYNGGHPWNLYPSLPSSAPASSKQVWSTWKWARDLIDEAKRCITFAPGTTVTAKNQAAAKELNSLVSQMQGKRVKNFNMLKNRLDWGPWRLNHIDTQPFKRYLDSMSKDPTRKKRKRKPKPTCPV